MVAEGYGPSHLLYSIVCSVDSTFSNVRILFWGVYFVTQRIEIFKSVT